jgi:hypothetical protein
VTFSYTNFLKFALMIVLTSCTALKNNKTDFSGGSEMPKSLVNKVSPFWLDTYPRFISKNNEGEAPLNLFFDVDHGFSLTGSTVNYIVETLQDSPVEYSYDLATGKHYATRPYCKQGDVWDKSMSKINRPPFTFGIVPRMFDQLGTPQKIIVFGNKKFMRENYQDTFFTAKIVGGFIEQNCPTGTCFKRDSWRSRLVLVGVERDSKYAKVRSIEELKKVVKWEEVKLFLRNGQGKNLIAGVFYPAVRVGALIDKGQTMAFLERNSIMLTDKKLRSIKNSCEKLFTYVEEQLEPVKKVKAKEEKVLTKSELKEKVREKYLKRLENRGRNITFARKFHQIVKKYNDKYTSCLSYFPSASYKYDKERFWFLTYLNAFFKLRSLGYAADCERGYWIENPVIGKTKKRRINPKEELKYCSSKALNMVIKQAPRFLSKLQKEYKDSFRFIDYDSEKYGSHKRIYNWVKVSSRVFSCDDPDKRDYERSSQPIQEICAGEKL